MHSVHEVGDHTAGTEASDPSDFIEWDVHNWSACLDFWQAHTTQDIANCSALEVGSRNGGLSLWMALQGARVVASDVVGPTQAALNLHQARGVSHRIEYELMDATQIPHRTKFDVVFFKSVLGSIGGCGGKQKQAQAVTEMHRALKKGGEMFFAENLNGCSIHRFFRRKFVKWERTWRYVSLSEMEEFLAPFSRVQYRTLGFAGTFGRSERQRNLLGILDKRVFNRTVPVGWRYIIIGVAKK